MDSTTKAIDPYGDVLAILPTTKTKLRVSSKILSTASPVFRAMFSPHFREGIALASTTELVEVKFPDESPRALEAIFNVLHFRHDCVSASVSYDVLYEIALVADKYNLVRALGPWKEVWLKRGAGDDGRGLFVMYVFGDRRGFDEGCRRAIMQDQGYDRGECDDGSAGGGDEGNGEKEGGKARENGWDYDKLPEKVIESISAVRVTTISSLLSVTEHFRNLYQGPGIKCKARVLTSIFNTSNCRALTCDAAILGSLVRHEAAIGIFPVPPSPYRGISVESLAKEIKGLRCFVDIDTGHERCMIVNEVMEKVDEELSTVDVWSKWVSRRWNIGDADS